MRKAFTLIELLVVVAIIALLISILLPALSAAKAQARADQCMSNQRQLAMGFLGYADDWEDCLPGSTWDFIGPGNSYADSIPLCWLGSLNSTADLEHQREHMPFSGTIFHYLSENEKVYKCPDDTMDKRAFQGVNFRDKPFYSYTSPVLLTGASTSMLLSTRWAPTFTSPWHYTVDWRKASGYSMPWMVVEEDEAYYLAFVTDSAWSNVDCISNRHKGRGTIAHTDGSVSLRAYQRVPETMTAWQVYYELADGRVVTAATWDLGNDIHPTFGFLRKAQRLNP